MKKIKSQKEVRDKLLSTDQTKAVNHQNLIDSTSYINTQFENLNGRDQLYANLTAIEKHYYLLTKEAFSADF